jgi:hypothetical protein
VPATPAACWCRRAAATAPRHRCRGRRARPLTPATRRASAASGPRRRRGRATSCRGETTKIRRAGSDSASVPREICSQSRRQCDVQVRTWRQPRADPAAVGDSAPEDVGLLLKRGRDLPPTGLSGRERPAVSIGVRRRPGVACQVRAHGADDSRDKRGRWSPDAPLSDSRPRHTARTAR